MTICRQRNGTVFDNLLIGRWIKRQLFEFFKKAPNKNSRG